MGALSDVSTHAILLFDRGLGHRTEWSSVAVNGGWGLQNNDHPVGSIDERWATSSPRTAEVGGLSGRRRTRGLFERDEAQMTQSFGRIFSCALVDPESAFLLALVSKLPYSFKELSRGKRIIFLKLNCRECAEWEQQRISLRSKVRGKDTTFAQNGIGS